MIWAIVVVMMAIGLVLLVAEVAIVPGIAVAGIAAALLLTGGAGLAWHTYGAAWGMSALLGAAVLAVGVIVIAPRTRAGKHLVLDAVIAGQHAPDLRAELLGKLGVAATSLRPAGAAEIGGRRVDVVTDGQFVEAGVAIKVIAVEGSRVVVVAAV